MALSIVNNPTAIGAQGGVNNVNNALAKTIKSLSTGLRINTAADDASGLAVSEKLRAQISGLSKAATNAQDAISMLQTAEGAMGSMTSMVQRIRELAVQAGDPAYTTNDRAMLQLEVDQLKDEIDRVSNSAEFNTKKLLNGDAAALWSASTDDIEAIVKGAPAEGNYKLTYDVDPGRNSVYKSNIMRLGEGQMSYDINSNGTSITKFDNLQGMLRGTDQSFTVQGSSATTAEAYLAGGTGEFANIFGKGEVFSGASAAATEGMLNGYSIEIRTVGGNTTNVNYTAGTVFSAGSTIKETFYVEKDGVTYRVAAGSSISGGITAVNVNNTAQTTTFGVTKMTANGTFKLDAAVSGKAFTASQIEYRVRDASTGVISDWAKATISISGAVTNDTVVVDGKEVDVFSSASLTVQGGTFGSAGFTLNMWESGEKMLINVGTARTSAANTATVQIGENGTKVHIPNATDPNTQTTHTIYTSQIDAAGNVYYGSMDITFERGQIVSGSGSIDILGTGDVASKYTKLSQLEQFTNTDGRMILSNTQEITIYAGNGKTAKVTLEGSDTVADVESKLTAAIVEQLEMGADNDNPNAANVNRNLVKYVETPTGGDHAVEGTFVIQTAVLGEDSNLTFVGDEAVLTALGVTQIQEASDSALNVRVTDAHTGEFIGEDTITDGRLRNVIQGVDINIAPESAADVDFKDGKMVFTDKPGSQVNFLHIKDNATKAAVGANEGQVIDISIGRLDTVGMGIDGVNVATFDGAQKAISKLDMALEQISAARATAGAQMNRLEYTINNLNTTRENMVSAESRIRDLDIAQASSDLAAQQVLLQSATAMLAQANQIPSYAAQLLQ